MPTNNTRRNSSVICNGIATNRLESWRRSFRQHKRTSMLDMNVLSKPLSPDHNDHAPTQKYLYSMEDAGCSYDYTNLLISIGQQYEYVDSEAHNIGHGAYGDVFKVRIVSIFTPVYLCYFREKHSMSTEKITDPWPLNE
jgi:hypothetical protein